MVYTPDPKDPTRPTPADLAGYMAYEFQALKGYIQTIVTGQGTSAGNNFAYSGSYRNRLYNGTFAVQQRQPTVTTVTAGNTEFIADRWTVTSSSGDTTCTPQQSGTLDGDFYLGMSLDTNVTAVGINQRIESADCKDMVTGAKVTMSGMIYYGPVVPNVDPTISIYTPDTNNDDYGGTPILIGSATVTPPAGGWAGDAWNFFKVTVTLSAAGYKGMQFGLNWSGLDIGLGYFINLSRLQLEIGAYNTPYERVPMAVEYLRCRRFYQQNDTTLAATATASNQRFTAYFSLGPMFRTPDLSYIDTGLVNGTHDGEEVISNTAVAFIASVAAGDVFCAFSVLLNAEI